MGYALMAKNTALTFQVYNIRNKTKFEASGTVYTHSSTVNIIIIRFVFLSTFMG